MLQSVPYENHIYSALSLLRQGKSLLTVKHESDLNTMVIGWGQFGTIWAKPMCMVMVRQTRHTFSIIEKAKDFTVSFAENGQKDVLSVCGSKSGRDIDKFKECGITPEYTESAESPVIKEFDIHLTCRKVYRQNMNLDDLEKVLSEKFYPKHNFHTMYYGEITGCYINK
jgi:flavin reductase (DIM6/NTAB) family NADH-FMN oxidoreductase RutF